ncbi:hypothetical protein [Oenococcus sicerae]|uniref:hypothetical protein n=2 Tax=Oenococcus sicerae TaxID=2203724 RepID=UPI0039EA792D
METRKVQKTNSPAFFLFSITITAAAFNCIWWLITSSSDTDKKMLLDDSTNLLLLLYTLSLAAGFFLTFNKLITHYWSLLAIMVSVLTSISLSRADWKIALLMLLFPILIFITNFAVLGLKSFFGLIASAFMSGAVMPSILFYFKNGGLTQNSSTLLITITLIFAFFLAPIFIASGPLETSTGLIFGLALIINLSMKGMTHFFWINALLILLTWIFLAKLTLRQKYRLPIYSMMMLISGLLFFYQIQA